MFEVVIGVLLAQSDASELTCIPQTVMTPWQGLQSNPGSCKTRSLTSVERALQKLSMVEADERVVQVSMILCAILEFALLYIQPQPTQVLQAAVIQQYVEH